MLQPVMDPLRRLQGGVPGDDIEINDQDRIWVAVDGMGGDHAPGPILEGCLQAIERLAVRIRFVGETDRVLEAAAASGLSEALNAAMDAGHLELILSGPSVEMHEEATVVRRKRNASINVAMDLVKRGEAQAVYSAGNSGAVMASAIFRLGRLTGIDRPAIGALFPTKDPGQPVLVLDVTSTSSEGSDFDFTTPCRLTVTLRSSHPRRSSTSLMGRFRSSASCSVLGDKPFRCIRRALEARSFVSFSFTLTGMRMVRLWVDSARLRPCRIHQ